MPDYSDGGAVAQILTAQERVWVTAVPAAARGKTTPRPDLVQRDFSATAPDRL